MKESWKPEQNNCINFWVDGAWPIRLETYIQPALRSIEGDTIVLSVAKTNEIKDSRGLDIHFGQYAIVDNNGSLFGVLYYRDAKKLGLRAGDKVKVAVSRRPWTASAVQLWALAPAPTT